MCACPMLDLLYSNSKALNSWVDEVVGGYGIYTAIGKNLATFLSREWLIRLGYWIEALAQAPCHRLYGRQRSRSIRPDRVHNWPPNSREALKAWDYSRTISSTHKDSCSRQVRKLSRFGPLVRQTPTARAITSHHVRQGQYFFTRWNVCLSIRRHPLPPPPSTWLPGLPGFSPFSAFLATNLYVFTNGRCVVALPTLDVNRRSR